MFSGRMFARAARSVAPRAPIAPRLAVRNYAAAAQEGAAVKPPVALYGVDGTYASALYSAAAKSSAVDPVAKAMENLGNVFQKDPHLVEVLRAPTLTVDDKKQIIAELQKHIGAAGDKAEVVKNFLETLAENNRLGALEGITEKYSTLMGAYRGEVELTVTSAAPLDAKVVRQLETAVSKSAFVGQGQKLKVVTKVDADIRGGLVVEVGDRTIDLSVSSKMAKMNKLLREQL